MEEETYLGVAKDALDAGNFTSGTLAALIHIAASLDEIAEAQNSIDLKLKRLIQYAGLRTS